MVKCFKRCLQTENRGWITHMVITFHTIFLHVFKKWYVSNYVITLLIFPQTSIGFWRFAVMFGTPGIRSLRSLFRIPLNCICLKCNAIFCPLANEEFAWKVESLKNVHEYHSIWFVVPPFLLHSKRAPKLAWTPQVCASILPHQMTLRGTLSNHAGKTEESVPAREQAVIKAKERNV